MQQKFQQFRESMSDVASGNIDDPKISIHLNGNEMVLDGQQARAFALGFLVSAKSLDGVIIESEINIKTE